MFWFAVGCMVSGLAFGALLKGVLVIGISSFQIVVFVFGLVLAGNLSGFSAVLWAVSGLFCHQSAYLLGLILHTIMEERFSVKPNLSVAAEIDRELSSIDNVAKTVASEAPELQAVAANLSKLVARFRGTLNNDHQLKLLLAERTRGSV